jgi:hypothetical protein
MDPRAGLDDVEERKFLNLQGLELDTSVVQLVVSCFIDSHFGGIYYEICRLVSTVCE